MDVTEFKGDRINIAEEVYDKIRINIAEEVYDKIRINIAEEVYDKVRPVWMRLSGSALLEKCLHCRTQNVDEVFDVFVYGNGVQK